MSRNRLRSATDTWLWPLVAMAGVAITILPRMRWVNIYEDQAVLAAQAMQVAAGEVPYRDFFSAAPPGAIFLYAGFFKLFGATVINERFLTGIAMVAGAGLVAHIGIRHLGPAWAAAVALLWGVWLPVFQEFSSYHFWSVTFILGMTAVLLTARSARRPRLLFALAGLAAAAALLMLQSSLPAVLAGLMVAWLIDRRIGRSVIPMLVAIAVPGVVVLVLLGLLGALPALITDTVLYSLQTFGATQALPFPWQPALLHDTAFWEASIGALWAFPMHWLLAVIAPIVVAVYTSAALWSGRRRPGDILEWPLIGILAAGLYASVLIVHMSDQNFWLSSPLTLILVAMPLKRMLAGLSANRFIAGTAAAPTALIYLAGLSPLVLGYGLTCHTDGTGFLREVETPSGSICTTFDSAPIAAGAVSFSSQNDEAIAFMPTGPSLYLITGRVPPVRVVLLIPGVTPPVEVDRTEKSMRALPVEWVIYYKIDFRNDLPAVTEIQDPSSSAFEQFLQDAYQRDDHDGLVVYRLKR